MELWRDRAEASLVPAASLGASLRDPRVIAFLLVWFGLNILFGVFSLGMPGVGQAIAWQAHIGGFLAGLLAFSAFDPVPSSSAPNGRAAPPPARAPFVTPPPPDP